MIFISTNRHLQIYCLLLLIFGSSHFIVAQTNYSTKNISIEKCLELASKYETEGDIKEATRYMNTAGITSWENKDYPKSIEYFNKSIELNRLINNKSGIAKIQSNLGMIYSDMGEYEASLNFFQTALDYRLANGERSEIISTYINKSVVLNNLKQYEEAASNLGESLTLATEMNDAGQMKSCYGMLAETYEKMGDQQKTLHYFNLYKTFHEMIQRNKINKVMKEVEAERLRTLQEELEKKEKEIQLLAAYKELKEMEVELSNLNSEAQNLITTNTKQELALGLLEAENNLNKSIIREKAAKDNLQKKIILFAVIGIVILVLFVVILYRNYKYKQKINSQLVARNEEIKELNDTLEKKVQKRTSELQTTMDRLEKQNRDLNQFSHVVSHNLRAPIVTILGLAEIVDSNEPGSAANIQVIKHLKDVVKNLDDVVKDLSSILEIKDNIVLKFKSVEVKKVLDSVKMQLSQIITETGIEIELDDVEAPFLETVRPYFESILFNLISNSLKYRSEKQSKIWIKTMSSDDGFKMKVSDNGIGIDHKHLSEIFKPYKRFTKVGEGKGLGLYMVFVQIEAMEGKVEVSSKLGQGSTFEVFLPKININS